MGTQKKATAVRRREIVQAALQLVASRGLQGLTIAGIAARIGLAPSALYRHFGNKDLVIDEILDLVQEQLMENVRLAQGETPEPLARLHRLLLLHLQFIGEQPGILPVVFSQEIMGGPPRRRAKVYALIRAYLREVADILRQGQAGGVIRADAAPETMALVFLGLIQPAAILWHLSGGEVAVLEEAERAWQIFAAGIAPTTIHGKLTGEEP